LLQKHYSHNTHNNHVNILTTDSYDAEAMYFHASVRNAKRAELEEGLAEVLAGPFDAQMEHIITRGMVRESLNEGLVGVFVVFISVLTSCND
jgi:hypothetical protein